MKKLILLILFSSIILCGCEFALEHDDAGIFFSAEPITRESFSADMVQNTFDRGQLIHFCIYSKEPFNTNLARVQILKKDPNTQVYGYSLAQGFDINPKPESNYTTGAFTIYSDGYYMMRVFIKSRPRDPIAQKTFWITIQEN